MKEKSKECGIIHKLYFTIIDKNILSKTCFKTKSGKLLKKSGGKNKKNWSTLKEKMSDQFFYFYPHIFGHISSILVIKKVLDNIF